MKSGIDWNELIPLLPKKMRDDIYLEAVAILSEQDDANAAPRAKKDDGVRTWRALGIPGRLVREGRMFRINRNNRRPIDTESEFGRVWALVRDSKGDAISMEGICSIAKGVGIVRHSDVIWYLWSRGFLDVENKP